MRSGWKSQARRILAPVVLVAAVLTPAWPVSQAASQAPATTAGAKADPTILGTIAFRHLSVFSRGGRVTAVAGVPSNEQLYYMGSTGGGVWRTTDAGATWTNISDGFFEAGSIGALAVAESDPNIIYAGTGSACPRGNISPGIGIYKSSDAGKTWQHIGLRESGMIGRIQVHPFNPNLVYVAVVGNLFKPTKERGVYRSRDGGKTWELVYAVSERTGAVDLTMDRKNPDVLIAGLWTVERKPWTIESGSAEGGMVKTTDGGNTWQRLRTGLPTGRHRQGRRVDFRRELAACLRADRSRQRPGRHVIGRMTAARAGREHLRAGPCSSARGTTRTSTPIPWTSTRSTRSTSAPSSRPTAARPSLGTLCSRTATTTTCGSTRSTTKPSSRATTAARR